jgi:hypothetical protein
MVDILLIVAISSQVLASLILQYIYIYRVREGEGVRDHRKNWQAPERNGYREFIERYSEQGKGCVCGWCLQNSERNREGFVS